ncbi:hypothetical protein ACIQI8_41975, partial [Streptomyces sp. NPDC092369]|uniref:hypothetical protein n=1 Tax=Streptomyces sp. NPDC092369 TaxID=3366015 RepID=UPI003810F062
KDQPEKKLRTNSTTINFASAIQIPAQAPEWNSASGILKARQFAQARIAGTRASAVAKAGSKRGCITRGPVW